MEDVYTDNNPEDTEKLIKKLKHIPLETIGCPELVKQLVFKYLNFLIFFIKCVHDNLNVNMNK